MEGLDDVKETISSEAYLTIANCLMNEMKRVKPVEVEVIDDLSRDAIGTVAVEAKVMDDFSRNQFVMVTSDDFGRGVDGEEVYPRLSQALAGYRRDGLAQIIPGALTIGRARGIVEGYDNRVIFLERYRRERQARLNQLPIVAPVLAPSVVQPRQQVTCRCGLQMLATSLVAHKRSTRHNTRMSRLR